MFGTLVVFFTEKKIDANQALSYSLTPEFFPSKQFDKNMLNSPNRKPKKYLQSLV